MPPCRAARIFLRCDARTKYAETFRGGITGENNNGAAAASSSPGRAGEYSTGGIIREGRGDSSDEEEEAPVPALPDREMQIPVLPKPPAAAEVMVSRLPNILGVKAEAFDPDTYVEEEVRATICV